MKIIRGLVMIACVAVFACVAAAEASAEQRNWFGPSGGRSMFWGGFFAPQPTFYPPSRRYYRSAPSRRSVHRDSRPRAKVARESPSSSKRARRTAALTGATSAIAAAAPGGRVTCERAQEIVAEFGFTEIQPETCEGRTYDFSATRDGKPFSIKIVAADGELAEVKKR